MIMWSVLIKPLKDNDTMVTARPILMMTPKLERNVPPPASRYSMARVGPQSMRPLIQYLKKAGDGLSNTGSGTVLRVLEATRGQDNHGEDDV